MTHNHTEEVEALDVLVVGTGVSGINTAYRLQTRCPNTTFAVLESRGDIGGTWDLFRYPGIRSDSDLFTYCFAWEPWPYQTPIADGELIRQYMKNCVAKYNLDRYMRFHHRVLSADWSRKTERWTVKVEHHGVIKTFSANWVYLGTGFYDYETPLQTTIPGIEKFSGKVIHPQFWPQDFDYSGKKIALIGSGATAITLFPVLAKTAEAVTLVQRSPAYVVSISNSSPANGWLKSFMPTSLVGTLFRWKYMFNLHFIVTFCRSCPNLARSLIGYLVKAQLPARIPHSPHFVPSYTPWDHRLCLTPDNEFFIALREKPKTNIVTGHIETVTENGLEMKDGTRVEADTIITATGLTMRYGGKIAITVNGENVDWSGRVLWNGCMVQNVPNLMLSIGYTANSWTLGADDAAIRLTRLINHMKPRNIGTAVPRVPAEGTGGTQTSWRLNAAYSLDAQKRLPVFGNVGPWRPRISPPFDMISREWGDNLSGLHFSP